MSKRLIVALDFDNKVDALRTLDLLDCNKCMVKVGLQLFVSEGWELISAINSNKRNLKRKYKKIKKRQSSNSI